MRFPVAPAQSLITLQRHPFYNSAIPGSSPPRDCLLGYLITLLTLSPVRTIYTPPATGSATLRPITS